MDQEYLYVYFHTPKAAGTTFTWHLKKNFGKDELLWVGHEKLRYKVNRKNRTDLYSLNKKIVESIPKAEREKIKVIYGHAVHKNVYKHFNKKVRYITFVRDPVLRTISYYNHFKTTYLREDKKGREKEIYRYHLLLGGKVPKFEDWVRRKYGRYNAAVETMGKLFAVFGYLDGFSKNALREMMNRFYFVGLTKHYDDDSLYLYHLLGINKFFLRQNISRKFIRKEDIDKNTLKIIESKNRIDRIIFDEAKEKRLRFQTENSDYEDIVSKMKIRRNLLLPETQIIFGYRNLAKKLNKRLRVKFPAYSNALDKIKGIER